MQKMVDGCNMLSVIYCLIVIPDNLSSYKELSVGQVDIVLSTSTNHKFYRYSIGDTRYWIILDPSTTLNARLSRRNGKQVQFAFCTLTRMRMNKSHAS